jgi:acyl-CoA synthetase (NDP forming)
MFAISDERIEAALDEAIAHGVRAITLYSSLVLAGDGVPALRERVLARVHTANLMVCGANGMGFYNFAEGIWGCGFQTRQHVRGGNVAYISHSGSAMCGIVDTDERIDFNYVVSTGQELTVSMDQYLDFVLDQPSTRWWACSWRPRVIRRTSRVRRQGAVARHSRGGAQGGADRALRAPHRVAFGCHRR